MGVGEVGGGEGGCMNGSRSLKIKDKHEKKD